MGGQAVAQVGTATGKKSPSVAQSQSTAPSVGTSTGSAQVGKALGGQNTLGNSEIAGRVGAAAPKAVLPRPLPGEVGKVTYYAARNRDYLSRHSAPPPPDYYLGYGDKYARRFTTVLKPTLSAKGQRWLEQAFVLLQEAMEDRLARDPAAYDALEMDSSAFRAFAYGTHPDAYLDAGLSKLPPTDLARIVSTPDLGDLMSLDGVSQVVETGVRILPQWGEQAWDGAKDLGAQAWDWATDW